MRIALYLIAVASAIYCLFAFGELQAVQVNPKGTVFQEISARISIGLSILIVTIAAGLAAVIGAVEKTAMGRARLPDQDAGAPAVTAAPAARRPHSPPARWPHTLIDPGPAPATEDEEPARPR